MSATLHLVILKWIYIDTLQIAKRYRKQIGLDLMRTMPNNVNFDSPDAEGVSFFFIIVTYTHEKVNWKSNQIICQLCQHCNIVDLVWLNKNAFLFNVEGLHPDDGSISKTVCSFVSSAGKC
jgi:hypothetical protein